MKKYLSLILALLFVLLSFSSCAGNSNQGQEESSHTSHIIEKGKCSVCGIDLFNELIGLLNDMDDKRFGEETENYEYFIKYYEESKKIEIVNHNKITHDRYYCVIRKGGMQSTLYEWGYIAGIGSMILLIKGTLDPVSFPSDAALEIASYYGCTEDEAVHELMSVKRKIETALKKTLFPLIEKSDNNLTPSDYGFINY